MLFAVWIADRERREPQRHLIIDRIEVVVLFVADEAAARERRRDQECGS